MSFTSLRAPRETGWSAARFWGSWAKRKCSPSPAEERGYSRHPPPRLEKSSSSRPDFDDWKKWKGQPRRGVFERSAIRPHPLSALCCEDSASRPEPIPKGVGTRCRNGPKGASHNESRPLLG